MQKNVFSLRKIGYIVVFPCGEWGCGGLALFCLGGGGGAGAVE